MPIHDWTRVNAGLFHHFHQRWIQALCDALNSGGLPEGYFALSEQVANGPFPDVLTLQGKSKGAGRSGEEGGIAVASTPPRTRFVLQCDDERYSARASRIVIRHPLGNLVAVIEIVSPGNKASRASLRTFVQKASDVLRNGIHLLVVDLFPTGPRDPQGIHKAIWDEIHDEPFELPDDKPLTLVAYAAGSPMTAYVEPVAVGDALPDMPIFLAVGSYVPAPLEMAYETTWSVCPQQMKDELAG